MEQITERAAVLVTIELPQAIHDQAVAVSAGTRNSLESFLAYDFRKFVINPWANNLRVDCKPVTQETTVSVTIELERWLIDIATEKAAKLGGNMGHFFICALKINLASPEVLDSYFGGGTSS